MGDLLRTNTDFFNSGGISSLTSWKKNKAMDTVLLRGRRELTLAGLFGGGMNPSMRMQYSRPKYLPKCSAPNTVALGHKVSNS